jgi:hypothetical protein
LNTYSKHFYADPNSREAKMTQRAVPWLLLIAAWVVNISSKEHVTRLEVKNNREEISY